MPKKKMKYRQITLNKETIKSHANIDLKSQKDKAKSTERTHIEKNDPIPNLTINLPFTIKVY